MIRRNIKIAAVAACCLVQAAAAEDPTSGPADLKRSAELVATVHFTKAQFEGLVRQMNEVASLLEKTDPGTSKVLREAVNEAQRAFIARDMNKVAQLLTEGLAAAALKREDAIGRQLRRVLDILRHGIMDRKDRRERIKNYREALNKVKELIDKQKNLADSSRLRDIAAKLDAEMRRIEAGIADIRARQKKLLADSEKLPSGKPAARRLNELRREIRDLINKQGKLNKASRTALSARLPMAGAVQKALSGQAGKTAEKLKKAAADKDLAKALSNGGGDPKGVSKAAARTGQAGGKMDKAGNALAKGDRKAAKDPQEGALEDLKEAEKALSDAIDKTAGGSKASEMAGKQGKLAEQTRSLDKDLKAAARQAGAQAGAPNLAKSASHMDKAAGKLGNQDPKGAAAEMKKALKELEDEKYKLAELRRKMKEKAKKPVDDQAKEQGDLAKKTDKTAGEMAKSPKSGAMPGQKSVSGAAGNMKQAAGQLGKGQCGSANSSQNEALDKLKKARRDLEEAIAREEELEQLETLVKIDAELQKILETQETISAGTKAVDKKRPANKPWPRAEELALAALSRGENGLAEKVDLIRKKLAAEGTTAVFPAVLEEVGGDLNTAAKRLDGKDPGKLTQSVQADIELALREMIDALRKEMSKRRRRQASGGGAGKGGGGGKKPPLVSSLAELKLLWRLEKQIQKRTLLLNGSEPDDNTTKEQIAEMHKKLAGRQAKVKTMTEKLAKKSKTKQFMGQ